MFQTNYYCLSFQVYLPAICQGAKDQKEREKAGRRVSHPDLDANLNIPNEKFTIIT